MELGSKTKSEEIVRSHEFATIEYHDEKTDLQLCEQSAHYLSDTDAESCAIGVEETEKLLKANAERGDKQALFLLGQLYYEEGRYVEAETVFNGIKDEDPRALYQLAVMCYDGLGTTADHVKAVEYMRRVAWWHSSDVGSIRYTALYNIGRAYMEGYGVQASDSEAERHFLLAADGGNPHACVKAQTCLGMFYSRPDTLDLKKAFYWHTEACGNGSLESQGVLGIMYLYGIGVQKDPRAALQCLREAAERGNVYAQGHLVAYYYHWKFYSKAATLAERISKYEDIGAIARRTDCLPEYISKGIATALFYHGRCLQLGRGVEQNDVSAKECFIKAAQLNPEVCKDLQMDVIYGRI
ncbi:LRP2-binding protein [Chanos chanos]|uniref:LRP2-binding protein n=1 Tax=Chanos chanos TaxID=29144 RepID=A0A6J2UM15_CHACN|nr:LRP2-binding protein [Chanos chanos]